MYAPLIKPVFTFVVFGLIALLLQRKSFNYSDNFPLLAVFDFLVSLALYYFFRNTINSYINIPNTHHTLLLVSIFLLFFFIGSYIDKRFVIDENIKLKYPNTYIFNFDYKYMFTKIPDVLFQQIFILTVLGSMSALNLQFSEIIGYFSILFIFIHIFLLIFMGKVAWLHVLLSIISSILFAFLILSYPFGYIYSFGIHLLGYLFFRILIWRKYRFTK